ncbi:hypothetical protein FB446DRAFT_493001 [Lentinula raphanica]|nr:hypothetical protein FB446DRAFT_493001 [Lentinula raphanica]
MQDVGLSAFDVHSTAEVFAGWAFLLRTLELGRSVLTSSHSSSAITNTRYRSQRLSFRSLVAEHNEPSSQYNTYPLASSQHRSNSAHHTFRGASSRSQRLSFRSLVAEHNEPSSQYNTYPLASSQHRSNSTHHHTFHVLPLLFFTLRRCFVGLARAIARVS